MVQILPQTPGLAEMLGQGLSSGVQTGLQHLIQRKMQETKLANSLKLAEKKQELAANQPMSAYQQTQTALRAKELGQKEQKENIRKSEWEYSQHKDFRKEVTENYRDAIETDMRLNRMQELNQAGALTSPATAVILDKLGLPVSVLGNPDSEEFDKLSKDLLKNIKTYFGARINVVEVENFMKTIPTLMNTVEGRDRIINNLKLLLEPRKLMFDEYRRLKNESSKEGKSLPVDLQETVLEKIKPELDELALTFEKGPSQIIGKEIAPENREFQKMPSAKDYANAIIEDDKGQRYKSDGKKWRKI